MQILPEYGNSRKLKYDLAPLVLIEVLHNEIVHNCLLNQTVSGLIQCLVYYGRHYLVFSMYLLFLYLQETQLIPVRCLTAHKLYPNPFKALRNLINFCAFWLLERYVGMYLRNTEIGKGRNRMNDCIALHISYPLLFGMMNLHLTPVFGS